MFLSDSFGTKKILCVDDDPLFLDALKVLNKQLKYDMYTAISPKSALEMLKNKGPFAVIVSDMQMPEMNGADFLKEVKNIAPNTVRILMTGQADLEVAITAIQKGQIFRFLTKPCKPELLSISLAAAMRQYELVISEQMVLEKVLCGSIGAMVEILTLAQPALFGHAQRVKNLVVAMADKMKMEPKWPLEVAAMLCQLSRMALPMPIFDKINKGEDLTLVERTFLERLPDLTDRLLSKLPSLDEARSIIALSMRPNDMLNVAGHLEDKPSALVVKSSQILKVCADYDVLENAGMSLNKIQDIMEKRGHIYDRDVLMTLFDVKRSVT